MEFINSWRSKRKQWDKLAIKIRFGKFTLFDLYYDHSKHQYGVILLNLGVRSSLPQKNRHEDNGKIRSVEDLSLL